jgi:hypothetical protein
MTMPVFDNGDEKVDASKTFDNIFAWDDNPRKSRDIYYEAAGWYLYRFVDGGNEYYLAHGCESSHGGDRWDYGSNCVKCGELPPDKFITVATLLHTPKGRPTLEDRV